MLIVWAFCGPTQPYTTSHSGNNSLDSYARQERLTAGDGVAGSLVFLQQIVDLLVQRFRELDQLLVVFAFTNAGAFNTLLNGLQTLSVMVLHYVCMHYVLSMYVSIYICMCACMCVIMYVFMYT